MIKAKGSNAYGFDAIRGVQAGGEFFVVLCPLKIIPRMFVDEQFELPPEARAQRTMNKSRIPILKNYILSNPKEYIFSSLAASVDGQMKFVPAPHQGPDGTIGRLYIDMNARMLINDGQHRRRAIEEALKEKQSLGYESISIVFLRDKGLKRSQQMFADLNKNAIKPSKSLSILYDHRNSFSQFIVKMVCSIDVFRGKVDFEKTTIGNRSVKVFTLNGILDATKKLLGMGRARKITEEEATAATDFWQTVSKNIPEWQMLVKGRLKSKEIREEYVHSSTNCLNSLGIAGRIMRQTYPDDWLKRLRALRDIDWSRSNPLWNGRLLQGGWMVRTTSGIEMGANAILLECGMPLSEDRMVFEK